MHGTHAGACLYTARPHQQTTSSVWSTESGWKNTMKDEGGGQKIYNETQTNVQNKPLHKPLAVNGTK